MSLTKRYYFPEIYAELPILPENNNCQNCNTPTDNLVSGYCDPCKYALIAEQTRDEMREDGIAI